MAKVRLNISTGQFCAKCGKDIWLAYQGYNRCACGQYLWIERLCADDSSRRYRYAQGAGLPMGYRGWMQVTQ